MSTTKIKVSAPIIYVLAGLLPLSVAYDLEPIAGTVQQLLTMFVWGLALLFGISTARHKSTGKFSGSKALIIFIIGLFCLAVMYSIKFSASPDNGLLALGALLASAAIFWNAFQSAPSIPAIASAFYTGVLLAGLVNAMVAVIQLLAPSLADDIWIATGSLSGRANGNMHQPNHLAIVLLWSAVCLGSLVELGRLTLRSALPALALLMLGVVLSASRMGLIGCALIGLWAIADRKMEKPQRQLFFLAPIFTVLAWWAANSLLGSESTSLGLTQKSGAWTNTSGRLQVWEETLRMIRNSPFFGVGWGEYNFVWTLSEKAAGQTHYFGNAHNLPLQLGAELGLPFALLVCGILLYAGFKAWQSMLGASGEFKTIKRAALMMLALLIMHSGLEYPLWYLAFLLPGALFFGICAAHDLQPTSSQSAAKWPALAGALMVTASIFAFTDYMKVFKLTSPEIRKSPEAMQAQLIAARQSLLYSGVAFRATALSMQGDPHAVIAAQYAAHWALDVPLMIAWADGLNAAGEQDKARYLAQRIAEFQVPEAIKFRAPCEVKDSPDRPYQCFAPAHVLSYRDFRQP